MALDYAQSASLRVNIPFQGRIGTAALKWASAILSDTSVDVSSSIARKNLDYARLVYAQPTQKAMELQPGVVQDPAVQAQDIVPSTGDSTITDPYLQQAVEATIAKVI